jgi:hypothetical protein
MLNEHVIGCFQAFGNEKKPSNSRYGKSAATPHNNGTDLDSYEPSDFICTANH